MKRLVWVLAVLVLSIAVFAPASAQDSSQPIVQLAVPFFAEDLLKPVMDQYMADNPGVQVQLVPYQGFGMPSGNNDDPETYLDNLASYFSSADVVLVDSNLSPEATRAGDVLNLMPLTQSDPSYNEAEFHPTLVNSFKWDAGQWALPISASLVVNSYIPQAFDDAGLGYPSGSWTIDDLDAAARALTKFNADGTVALPGLTVQGNNALSALFLSLLGQSVFSDSTIPNNPDFSNPDLQTFLDKWLKLQTDGILTLPDGADSDQVPMRIGQAGIGGGGGPGGFRPPGTNANAPVRTTALLPGGRAGLNVNGYAVSAGTAYPDAAYNFVKFLVHDANMITISLGNVPAVQQADLDQVTLAGNTGGLPPFIRDALLPPELVPLVDEALAQGITLADRRFANGITNALSLMESDGLDAQTALDQALATITAQLNAADARATSTHIVVNAPKSAPVLASNEIALNFATLAGNGGGGPGGGLATQNRWQATADAFAADDAEVGVVNLKNENLAQLSDIAQNYDCFYSSTNLVPDADLSLLLNLDPLLNADPSFDRSDYISGVFNQVMVNNQTWALPLQISPVVMRFNYDSFSTAGVTPPNGSWTVSEFQDTVNQLKNSLAADQVPVQFNAAGQSAILALIAAYGGLPFDTRTTPITVNFTDQANLSAIQQVLDLVHNGDLSFSAGGPGGFGGGDNSDNPIPLYSGILNVFGFGGFGGGPGGGGGFGGGNQNTDGLVTFPRGDTFNLIPANVGTVYISASTQHADACYRFITYLSNTTDLFEAMPARHSQINSPDFVTAQGAEKVAFFSSLADLMEQPSSILMSTNVNAGNFGMTNWLFDVFTRYQADEVADLPTELATAQQITQDYLTCVAAIPPIDPSQGNIQSFFDAITKCQTSADPGATQS